MCVTKLLPMSQASCALCTHMYNRKGAQNLLNGLQVAPPPQPDRRPFFSGQARELDEEAMKRSSAAAQQLGSAIGDPASIGARLMGKMGFGIAGQGLGRAGQVSPSTLDRGLCPL